MKFALLLALCAVMAPALAQRRPQSRPTQGGRPGQEDTRLGLIADQIGVPPVPGGIPNTGVGGLFPVAGRDESCWCQPVNQVCTPLRPENLDLVTRIINRPGSPGSPGSGGSNTGCPEDRRLCCPPGLTSPIIDPGFPGPGFPGQGFSGQCGVRTPFGFPPAFSPTADFGEYPWMAVIMGPGQAYMAGGVLIANGWVLTAAHKLTRNRGLTVRLGDYDVGTANDVPQFPEYESRVAQVIVHPQYNSQTLANNVALLQLRRPVNTRRFQHVTPACIPAQGQQFNGQRCFVTGWGQNAFTPGQGQFQSVLQEVDVPVVDPFRCESQLRNTRLGQGFILDQRSFICAGGERDKDSCRGDGGSPLMCGGGNNGWIVAGLVAWGVGCGEAGVPAAYVNVANYANFIRQYVN